MPSEQRQSQVDAAVAKERTRVSKLMYSDLIDSTKQKFLVEKVLADIKADKEATFGTMQDVMQAMQENHLERFLIITDNELEEASEA